MADPIHKIPVIPLNPNGFAASKASIALEKSYFEGTRPDKTDSMKTSLLAAACLSLLSAQAQKPDIIRFEPKEGTKGTVVKIAGKNLGKTSKVLFGGVLAASFSVINDSLISATVGNGASGRVQVNTPAGEDTLGFFTYRETAPVGPMTCEKILDFRPVINEIKTDLHCFRDSVLKLRVTNGEFRSYRWSNGDTTPYTYVRGNATLTVRVGNAAAGCFSKPTVVKFVRNSRPLPELVFKDSILSTRPPAPFHRWYFEGKLVGDGPTLKASKIGVYRLETSDDKVCWTSSKEFKVTIGSLVSPSDSIHMRLYPNPTNGPFTVAIILPTERRVRIAVKVTDATGSVVARSGVIEMTGRELYIPLRVEKKGTYRVTAEVNGKVVSKVLFVQ